MFTKLGKISTKLNLLKLRKNYFSNTTRRINSSKIPKRSIIIKESEEFKETKLRLAFALGFFTVGGIVEMYTYADTKDFSKSHGLGWGLLAAILV